MFDLPLHPVVVHFPIVFGIILPFAAFVLWWGIRKGTFAQNVWVFVPDLALVYGLSAAAAVYLGGEDEEKVEKIVEKKVVEAHEEAGEVIPWLAGGLLLVSIAGLVRKDSHRLRLAFAVLSLAAIIPLANTGHTGGQLVYKYGAAKAHLPANLQATVPSAVVPGGEGHDKDHD